MRGTGTGTGTGRGAGCVAGADGGRGEERRGHLQALRGAGVAAETSGEPKAVTAGSRRAALSRWPRPNKMGGVFVGSQRALFSHFLLFLFSLFFLLIPSPADAHGPPEHPRRASSYPSFWLLSSRARPVLQSDVFLPLGSLSGHAPCCKPASWVSLITTLSHPQLVFI